MHYPQQSRRLRTRAPFALKVLPNGTAIAPKPVPRDYCGAGFTLTPCEDIHEELTPTLDAIVARVREIKLRRAFAALNEAE